MSAGRRTVSDSTFHTRMTVPFVLNVRAFSACLQALLHAGKLKAARNRIRHKPVFDSNLARGQHPSSGRFTDLQWRSGLKRLGGAGYLKTERMN